MQERLMALHLSCVVVVVVVVVAVAVATLVAGAGSASAQHPAGCTVTEGSLLLDFPDCYSYLTNAAITVPGAACCLEVNYVTNSYGADCLCLVILYVKNDPSLLQFRPIHGRAYNLASGCKAPANMSACTTCCSANSPLAGLPPGVSTPTFQVPAAPVRRSKVSTGALAGGSIGGVSVLGIFLFILYKCLDAPCWCCQRREKPCSSNGGTAEVPYGGHTSK